MEETVKKKKHTLIKILIVLVLIIFIVCFYSKTYEIKHIVVKEYRIEKENIPSSFDSVKIIQFSDINFGTAIYNKELNELIDKINSYEPEIVIFTGNLIYKDYKYKAEDIENITTALSNIKASVGKYAISGIHDNRVEEYNLIMANSGFKLLENDYDLIYYKGYTPIYIGGLSSYLTTKIDLDSTLEYYKDKEEETFLANYKIMLVNESDAIKEILRYRDDIDLILSGNTLGGIIKVPFYGPLIKQEGSTIYYEDYVKENNTDIYVSGGVGTNWINIRLFNYPSINLYRLKSIN